MSDFLYSLHVGSWRNKAIAVLRWNTNWLSSVIACCQIISAWLPVLGFVLHYKGKVCWRYDIWITSTMLPFSCEELIEKITEIIILLLKMRETVSLVCSFCFCFLFYLVWCSVFTFSCVPLFNYAGLFLRCIWGNSC